MKQNMRNSATLAGLTLATMALGTHATAQTSDPALNALVKKGILTEQEARDALAETAKMAKPAANQVQASWKDGLNFQSADGKFKGKIGGRLHLDAAAFSEDAELEAMPGVGDIPAAVEVRRARLSVEGDIGLTTPVFYKVEFDFAPEEVEFKDVYLGLDKLPVVQRFQVGHFKEPIGLELLTSSRFLTFLERATPTEAFAPERNLGGMFSGAALNEHLTWAAGAFTDTDSLGRTSVLDSNYRFSGRVTGLPWYDEEAKGARLLHVGVSGSYMDLKDDAARFRSRPEAHLAPRFVDTGTIPGAEHASLAAAEAAVVLGPFSVQAEYYRTWVSADIASPTFDGFYVFGSWFITGEHRPYRRSTGVFDRVIPKNNFALGDGGPGAWEVAVRYSYLDLDSEGFIGGRLNDITGGVNWYLNPNFKVQFNYVYAMADRGPYEGGAHILQGRFAVDF